MRTISEGRKDLKKIQNITRSITLANTNSRATSDYVDQLYSLGIRVFSLQHSLMQVVYKLEFDAKSRGRTEAKQHMTSNLQTHSLTKSIRHQNACPRRGVHTQERNF